MNKKFSLLAAGTIALFLSACGDNVVESYIPDPIPPYPENPEIPPNIAVETTAKLTVVVTDAVTGEPLASTKVTLSGGTSATTSATGTVVFDSLHIGSYSLIIEKAGYASGISSAIIELANTSTEYITVVNDVSTVVALPPLTSGLSGYLYYTDETGKKLPAEKAKVRVQLNGSYLQKVYETEVGADGKYAFVDTLPAVSNYYSDNYSLYALEFTAPNGVTYKTRELATTKLLDKATAHAEAAAYQIEDDVSLFALLYYTNAVDSSGAAAVVKFEFSDAIDVAKVGTGSIQIGTEVANVAWSNGNKTLTLTPRTKWNNTFDVILDLKSVGGKDYFDYHRVIVVGDVYKEFLFDVLPTPAGYQEKIDSSGTKSTLVFKFSDTVDVAKKATDWVTLNTVDQWGNSTGAIAADITWSKDSLYLKPIGGTWTDNFSVNISRKVKSIRNVSLGYDRSYSISLNNDSFLAVPFKILPPPAGYKEILSDSTDTLVFKFSDKIDVTKLAANSVTLQYTSGLVIGAIAATIIWDADSLRLMPKNGKWTGNFTVNIAAGSNSGSIRSIRGKTLENLITAASGSSIYTSSIPISLKLNDPLKALPFILVNRTDFPKTISDSTTAIVFEFSDAVDVTQFNYDNYIPVTVNNNQVANFIWEGEKLTVKPVVKWTGAFSVSFGGTFYSIRGNTLSPGSGYAVNFETVDLKALKVTGLEYVDSISHDFVNTKSHNFPSYGTVNSYFALKFTPVVGATGYKLYAKATAGIRKGTFVPLYDATSYYDWKTDTVYVMNYAITNSANYAANFTTPLFSGNGIEFAIQAYNGKSQTLIDPEEAVLVYDKIKPTIASGPGLYYPDSTVSQFGYHNWEGSYNYRFSDYSNSSYVYTLINDGNSGWGLNSYNAPSVSGGLSPNYLGYHSDLAYYLSKGAAYTGNPRPTGIALSNNIGVANDLIGGCSLLSEPMDTNSVATGLTGAFVDETSGEAIARVIVHPFWSTSTTNAERTLCYVLRVAAGDPSEDAINGRIIISGLKDKRGNAFEINYTGGTPVKKSSTLDFKLTSIGYPIDQP